LGIIFSTITENGMNAFIGPISNWASIIGLIISVILIFITKSARKAAKEAKDATYNLVKGVDAIPTIYKVKNILETIIEDIIRKGVSKEAIKLDLNRCIKILSEQEQNFKNIVELKRLIKNLKDKLSRLYASGEYKEHTFRECIDKLNEINSKILTMGG